MRGILIIVVLGFALQGVGQEVEGATLFNNEDIIITSSNLDKGFNFECLHDRQAYHLGVYDKEGELVTEQVVKDYSVGSFNFDKMEGGSYDIVVSTVNKAGYRMKVYSRNFLKQ